ncbi:hypothetical protein H4582DRAFT_2059331 [Lactarius indigo]|nr:hypothetical protein H4582DRAFT_2059331 [Lactarius indigo]
MALVAVSCFFACLTDAELVRLPEDEVALSTDSDKVHRTARHLPPLRRREVMRLVPRARQAPLLDPKPPAEMCPRYAGLLFSRGRPREACSWVRTHWSLDCPQGQPSCGLRRLPSAGGRPESSCSRWSGPYEQAGRLTCFRVEEVQPKGKKRLSLSVLPPLSRWYILLASADMGSTSGYLSQATFCVLEVLRWRASVGKPLTPGGFGSVTTGMQDRERGKLGRGGLNWSSTRETSRVDYFKTTFVLADWIFIPKLTHKFERLKTILTPVPAVLRVKYGRMHLARPFDMPHLTEVTQIGQDLTNGNWVIFRFAGRPATPHFYLLSPITLCAYPGSQALPQGTRRTKPTSHSLVSSRLALARSRVNSPWSLTLLFLLSHRCGIRSASDSHGLSSVRRRTPQVTTYFLLIACKLIVGTSTLGFATRPVTTSSSRRRPNTACKPPQHRAKIPLQHQCEFRPNASRKRRRQLGHYSDGGYDSDNYAPTTVRTTMGMAILQTRNGFKNPPKLCQPVS